jgi:hypothetical protein
MAAIVPPLPPVRKPPLPWIFQLERLLWAFEGIADLLNPDQVLDSEERSHVSTLVEILTERMETVLHALIHERTTLPTAPQEARVSQAPTPPEATDREGEAHV